MLHGDGLWGRKAGRTGGEVSAEVWIGGDRGDYKVVNILEGEKRGQTQAIPKTTGQDY